MQKPDYRWLRCSAKMVNQTIDWLDFDPLYLGLDTTAEERIFNYRTFLSETIPDDERTIFPGAVTRGKLTGGDSLVDEIEQNLKRRIGLRRSGRPSSVEILSKSENI